MRSRFVSNNSLRIVWITFLVCYAAGITLTVLFFISIEQAVVLDFVSFLTGASIISGGDADKLYELTTQLVYQQALLKPFGVIIGQSANLLVFLNLPLFALMFVPFTYLSFLTGYKLYVIVLLSVLAVISVLSAKIFENFSLYSIWPFIPFLFYPSIGAVFIGQTSVFLVLLFLLVYFYMKRGNYFFAGLAAALFLLKIQYIISVPFLFVMAKNKKEFLKGWGIASAVLLGINFLIAGFFLDDYLRILVSTQKPEFGLLESDMFTLYASLKQINFFSNLSFYELVIVNTILYLSALTIFLKIQEKLKFDRKFVAVVLLTLVFCVHGVDYDLSLLLIPILILINLLRFKIQHSNTDTPTLFVLVLLPLLMFTGYGLLVSFTLLGATYLLIYPFIQAPQQNHNPL